MLCSEDSESGCMLEELGSCVDGVIVSSSSVRCECECVEWYVDVLDEVATTDVEADTGIEPAPVLAPEPEPELDSVTW